MENQEVWKSLKGLQQNGDYYEVSNLGRVRSVDRYVKRINSKPYFQKGVILKQTQNRTGYLTISLKLEGTEKKCEIHRLVAKAFVHNEENKPIVNHKDSDQTNNRWDNLEWATQSDNIIHAQKCGRKKDSGTNHYSSRLSKEDVSTIREMYSSKKYTLKKISERFNMTESGVWLIVNYKTHREED